MPDYDPKVKSVTVKFLPSLNLPDDVIEGTGRVGHKIHATDAGIPIGYCVFRDSETFLYPTGIVLKIHLDL